MVHCQRFVYTSIRGCDCVVPRWIYREWAEGGLRHLIQECGLDRGYSNPVEEQAFRNITRFSFALRRFYLEQAGVRDHLTRFERDILLTERAVMNKFPWLGGNDLYVAICNGLHQRGLKSIHPRQLQGLLYDISQKMIDLQAIQDSREMVSAEVQRWREVAQALLEEELAAETL